MSRVLLITVRLHEGRYYGAGEWPPSPARLFQALVAGAGLGGPLTLDVTNALAWLEQLDPAIIASPRTNSGQSIRNYVPNNDLDAKTGDQRRIGQIRTQKVIQPRIFDAEIPFLYAWLYATSETDEQQASVVGSLADWLYQFGRGADFAWAWGELLDAQEFEDRLSAYPGVVYRPSVGGDGQALACPASGSLSSLQARYKANSRRFKTVSVGKSIKQLFSQPPKPRFVQIAYETPPSRHVYELRSGTDESSLVAWPLTRSCKLVVAVRDGAVARLRNSMPERSAEIERVLVGRKSDGADDGPTSLRVRIVPLPSIGHQHVDREIRRILVEVPAACPLRADDVDWAFSGLNPFDPETGEAIDVILTPSDDESMLAHFDARNRVSRVWRTVTPAALPEPAMRRRIDPTRKSAEAKNAAERAAEQERAAATVFQALRHAEVGARPIEIHVQREPFGKGDRVEAFALGTRFTKQRLWHVELILDRAVPGPLVIGDGRFLGLGVMEPVQRQQGVHALGVESGLVGAIEPTEISRALRRAVMARVQAVIGVSTSLPAFFSGHEQDGSIAHSTRSPHLAFSFDPVESRLLIVAPHVLARRVATPQELGYLQILEAAVADFRELRAGSAGLLALRPSYFAPDSDPLFAPSRDWESITPYQVTRHAKRSNAADALSEDLCAECCRRGLPRPRVTAHGARGVPGVGLVGHARLTFEVAVDGPIILGKSRHLGGGLFVGGGR